jgi:hypothetical protein
MNEITINNFNKKDKKEWTLIQMKTFCKKNKLLVSGKKDDIYKRIKMFLNQEIVNIENSLKELQIKDNTLNIQLGKYLEFKNIVYTKLDTIYFDYIKNRFYILVNYDGKENIDKKIGCFKKDTKDIKNNIKKGILYKDCTVLFLGFWFDEKNKKVYNIDY